MKTEYNYENIFLIPKMSIVNSRQECNCSVKFGDYYFNNPVIPANMASVVDTNTCLFLCENNMFYIMHRFQNIDYNEFIKTMHDNKYIASISVGINSDSYDILYSIFHNANEPEFITIDVANAFSEKTKEMIKFIKSMFENTFLIVGNCCTPDAVLAIEEWGADSVKIGIAGGSVCSTYMSTGFTRPQFSAVLDCSSVAKKPIIADGGIRNIGDIAKAHVAGAHMVMAGSLFAGYDESAGAIIEFNNEKYKQYFGSASFLNKGNNKNIEGICKLIPLKGKMSHLINQIEDGLKSAISYAGGSTLSSLNNLEWRVFHK